MLEYRRATPDDALYLSTRLRECDVIELQLSHGNPPEAVISSLDNSPESIVALDEGVPVAIGGCGESTGMGVPWLLAAPGIYRHRKSLIKDVRPHIERWASKYPVLFNYVHSENTTSIAWLKHLGFTLGTITPVGASGAPFYPFYRFQRCAPSQ